MINKQMIQKIKRKVLDELKKDRGFRRAMTYLIFKASINLLKENKDLRRSIAEILREEIKQINTEEVNNGKSNE